MLVLTYSFQLLSFPLNLLNAGTCFKKGNYEEVEGTEFKTVVLSQRKCRVGYPCPEIRGAPLCQQKCTNEKLGERTFQCEFWSYDEKKHECKLFRERSRIGNCDHCVHGPRLCSGESNFNHFYRVMHYILSPGQSIFQYFLAYQG